MLSHDKLCKLLKITSLARGLSELEIQNLARTGSISNLRPGQLAIVEEEPSDSILVLLEGEAEILKGKLDGKPNRIRNISAGETLGELGFLLNEPRSCSVRVTRPTQIFSLHREAFDNMLATGDSAGGKISIGLSKVMGQRMNQLTDEAVKLLNEHDSLLATIERMKVATSTSDIDRLRQQLSVQAEQMRQKQLHLKKTVNQLNVQVEKAKVVSTGLQVMVGLIAGSAVLGFAYFQGAFDGVFSQTSSLSYPASIPYLENERTCTESGKLWCNEQCLDIEHNINF